MAKKRAEANIIGRLAVQVTPDLSGFHQKLKAYLKAIDDQIELHLGADFDYQDFERSADAALGKLNEQFAEAEARVHAEVELESRKAAEEFAGLKREWGKRHLSLPVDLEAPRATEVDRLLKAVEGELLRRHIKSRKIPFEVDLSMSEEDLREIRHKLKDLRDDFNHDEIEFKAGLDKTATYVTAARLGWLSRDRWVRLKPLVDPAASAAALSALSALSGFRLAKDLTSNLWDLVKNMDKAVPKIGAVAAGLSVAVAAAATLSAHTLTVAGGLVHAVQAVSLLGPGFAVAGGMLAASFIVPLKNIDDYVGHIKQDFSDLADTMGNAFWAQALPSFEQGYWAMFDRLREGLQSTSVAAGKHFSKVLDSFGRILAPQMDRMFSHVSAGLDELGRYSDSFAVLLGVLGRHGSFAIERFLGALGRVTEKWAKWLDQADRSGRLEQIIERGIGNLKAFGRILGGIGRTLSGLFRAAEKAGGATLDRMADGLDRLAKGVNGEVFQREFSRTLEAGRKAWSGFTSQLKGSVRGFFVFWAHEWQATSHRLGVSAGKLLRDVLGALSSPVLTRGVNAFVNGLSNAVESLSKSGMWDSVSRGLSRLLELAGSMMRGFAPVIAQVVKSVSEFADRLAPILSRIVESWGPRMASAIEMWTRVTVPLAESLARLVELLGKIPGSIELIVSTWGAGKIAKLFAPLAGILRGKVVQGVVGGAVEAAAEGAISGGLGSGLISALKSKLSGVLGLVGKVVKHPAAWAVGGLSLMFSWLTSISGKVGEVESKLGKMGSAFSLALRIEDPGKRVDALRAQAEQTLVVARELADARRRLEEAAARGGGYHGKSHEAIREDLLKVSSGEAERRARAVLNSVRLAYAEVFSEIRAQAERDMPAALRSLQDLNTAMRGSFSDPNAFAAWKTVLSEAISKSDYLGTALDRIARSQGFASAESAGFVRILQQGSIAAAFFAAEQQRLEGNSRALQLAFNAQKLSVGDLQLSYEQARGAANVISEIAPQFMNMSEAVRSANGEAVSSIEDVVRNLEAQAEAQRAWADNVVKASKYGISEGFLKELSKVPDGAAYLKELVEGIEAEGDVGGKFQDMAKRIRELYPAMSDTFGRTQGVLEQLNRGTSSALARVRDDIAKSLDKMNQHGDAARVRAAKTADDLLAVLNDAGVQLSEEQGRIFLQTAQGYNDILDAGLSDARAHGSSVVDEYRAGMNDKSELAKLTARRVAERAVGMFKHAASDAKNAGSNVGENFTAGVLSKKFEAGAASSLVASGVVSGLGSKFADASSAGVETALKFAAGVDGRAFDAYRSGSALSERSAAGLNSSGHLSHSAGSVFANAYATSLSSGNGAAWRAGRGLASNASDGAGSVSLWSVGSWVAQGFAQGISDNAWRASVAASSMAAAGAAAARYALNINSPSKVFRSIGLSTGEGLAQGIEWSGGLVVSASEDMAFKATEAARNARTRAAFRSVGETLGEALSGGLTGSLTSAVGEAERIVESTVSAVSRRRMPVRLSVDADSSSNGGVRKIEIHQHIAVAQVPAASDLAAQAAEEARLFEGVSL